MREQLEKYVELLFAGTPDSDDMQQEILQNTLDRYDDLIEQGKTPTDAYRLAIAGIGDVDEMLWNYKTAPVSASVQPAKNAGSKKKLKAVAIGMYICSILPLIALGSLNEGVLGLCMTILMVAAATVLIIWSSNGSNANEARSSEDVYEVKHPSYKLYKSIAGPLTLTIYLLVSFLTSAWHLTWLIFPISGAVDSIAKALIDLKEANENET